MFNTPILFVIFNRLDTSRLVFQKIKEIRPCKLFIASDGPRNHITGEADLVFCVRNYVLSEIDWNCEVLTLFHEENLGCGRAVSTAVNWFFNKVEKGIILEDDCLPDLSFFNYCEMALNKYEFNPLVSMISGFNPFGSLVNSDSSFFSENPSVWGWASWSNRLCFYDFDIKSWPMESFKNYLRIKFPKEISQYYMKVFTEVKEKRIDTWDYQLTYLILSNSGLTLKPKSNLIQNIGIEGAHANGRDSNHFIPFGFITLLNHKFPDVFMPDLIEDYKFYKKFVDNKLNKKIDAQFIIFFLLKIKNFIKKNYEKFQKYH